MPLELVSRRELARRAGKTAAAVTAQCRPGGHLHEAIVGDRIDASHPAAVAWIAGPATPKKASKKATKKKAAKKAAKKKVTASQPSEDEPSSNVLAIKLEDLPGLRGIEDLADQTLRYICQHFGTGRALKDWLDARKKIEDVRHAELDNGRLEDTLVSRERVKTAVFGIIEASNRRLLQDFPKAAVRRLYGACRAGQPPEEAERILRDLISAQLTPVKAQAQKALRKRA